VSEIVLTAGEQTQLAACEAVIDKGIKIFVTVGLALAEIREKRLYRGQWSTFEEYCDVRWGFKRSYAYEIMEAATTVKTIEMSGIPDIGSPINVAQARPLAGLDPGKQIEVWQEAKASAPNGKVTAAHVEAVASQHRPAPTSPPTPTPQRTLEAAVPAFTPPSRQLTDEEVEVVIWRAIRANARFPDKAESQLYWLKHATPGDFSRLLNPGVSFEADQLDRIKGTIEAELTKQATPPTEEMDSNEWYTPSYILMPARKALGSIDLDPASCATANEVVKATTYYDKAANGLLHPWRGNVWLNPPYSDPLPWIEKLLSEYMAGQVITALVLVNTANSPQWAQLLWSNTQASVCMLNCRIKFWRPDRPEGKGGDRDQMLWWVGPTAHPNSHERFRRAFDGFGPFR